MTREQARERLLDYAYGEMSQEEVAAFEAVLRDDPELRAELDEVAFVRRAAAELPVRELPAAARRHILAEADRVAGRRAWALRWERLQAFFLSPAFAGAAVVIVAAVVGIQVLIQHGPADLWGPPEGVDEPVSASGEVAGAGRLEGARMEAAEATAVVASGSGGRMAEAVPEVEGQSGAESPATRGIDAAPSRASKAEAAYAESSARSDQSGRAAPGQSASSTRVPTRSKRTTVARVDRHPRKEASGSGATRERATNEWDRDGAGLLGGAGEDAAGGVAPGGRAGVMSATGAPSTARATAADADRRFALPPSESQKDEAEAGAEAEAAMARSAPSPAAQASAVDSVERSRDASAEGEAAETLTRAKAADSAQGLGDASPDDSPATDAVDLLAEARQARGAGRLADALALCRRALGTGPTGGLLADVLAEAAEVALELSRPTEAERYLERLERLPGGTARAATIRSE